MKSFSRVFSAAVALIWAASSAYADLEPYVCSRSEMTGVAVDFSPEAVRTPKSANDILPFVYNNTEAWTAGGDLTAPAVAIEVSQMSGEPTKIETWKPVAGKTKMLTTVPGESAVVWMPSGGYLYRAKMTVGASVTYAYFDLSATTDIKMPVTDMTITLSSTELDYTTDSVRPTMTVMTESGVTLTEEVDYRLDYSDDVNVGTCTVTITGIGNYSGVAFAHYTIVYPVVAAAEPVTCTLDLRTDSPLVVDLPSQRVPWAWNSTADWIPGGDEKAIDITYIPLARADAEPDETLRQTLFTRTGEGAAKVREPKGWCLVEMGSLSRCLYFKHQGLAIVIR